MHILGSVGVTELIRSVPHFYTTSISVNGIKENRLDIGIAGSAEAPLLQRSQMGLWLPGIADDKNSCNAERNNDQSDIDYTRACRPLEIMRD